MPRPRTIRCGGCRCGGPTSRCSSSKVADTNNVGGSQGGAITAALFMRRFVTAKSWLHFDVFAWNASGQSRTARRRRVAGGARALCAACGALRLTMPAFDPRVTPARADLAAKSLEGKVTAARFAEGRVMEVIEPQAPLRREPRPDAPLDTEALKGERVTVYDSERRRLFLGPACRRQLCRLAAVECARARRPRADAQGRGAAHFRVSGPVDQTAAARSAAARRDACRRAHRRAHGGDGERRLCAGGASRAASANIERDFVAVAERFLGVPYLWGGKTALGLDCSGLVQVALDGLRHRLPARQRHAGGRARRAARGRAMPLKRGDLVFWKGHVAIVRDATSFSTPMRFTWRLPSSRSPKPIARIRAAGSEVTSVRRIGR